MRVVHAIYLATSASQIDLNRAFASAQMAFSLGWHILLASFGVGFPVLLLYAEWQGHRKKDATYLLLAKRWAKAVGVMFAVGAVSGTILSFELGILWPGLMAKYGAIFGFPFTLEGFAFFIEAIFLGIYLYGWSRLSYRAHILSGIPIALAGTASAFFVVAANAWMNDPTGFRLVAGKPTDLKPWAGVFNPATPTETTHMIVAAFMITGFGVASVYAYAILRGKDDRYHQLGLKIGLGLGAILAPIQGIVGDLSARYVAARQPVKLAAMEALFKTARHVPETLGGFVLNGKLLYAIRIPDGLSLLTHFSANAQIIGLDSVPAAQRPPVNPVHLAFDAMTGIGFLLFFIALWLGYSLLRTRSVPSSKLFLWLVIASGPLAGIATETGWMATEVGRQPWIVYHVMTVYQAVNPAPGLWLGLPILIVLYSVLTVVLIFILRRVARTPLPVGEITLEEVDRMDVLK